MEKLNSAQCNDDKAETSIYEAFVFTVIDCLGVWKLLFIQSEWQKNWTPISQMMLTIKKNTWKNECKGRNSGIVTQMHFRNNNLAQETHQDPIKTF